MSGTCPISILIPAFSEAANIQACVASASFCNEIVVVDSGSTDGTCSLAREAGATTVEEMMRVTSTD